MDADDPMLGESGQAGDSAVVCTQCNGRGSYPPMTRQICNRCHGTSVEPESPVLPPEIARLIREYGDKRAWWDMALTTGDATFTSRAYEETTAAHAALVEAILAALQAAREIRRDA